MLHIKKLDKFILKSFLFLFVGTFFICLFIFMMQFLWRYVEILVGKGLTIEVLAKFFFYSALTLLPASLPLAVLLASLITFGNFGERYELLAMKAAGISLLKIMRPLIFFVLFLVGVSFYFQNVIGPKAEVKLWTLVLSLKQKSPELDIPEGVFYDEISGYNIYIKHKDRDTGLMHDVMIYNFSDGFENARIIVSESGKLELTADKKHLYLHLYDGEMFENIRAQKANAKSVPYRRESFKEKHTLIAFDSDFSMIDGGFIKDNSRAKGLIALQHSIDSMSTKMDSIGRSYYNKSMEGTYRAPSLQFSPKDSVLFTENQATYFDTDSLFNAETLKTKDRVLTTSSNRLNNMLSDWQFKRVTLGDNDYSIRKHITDWHKKFTLSLACLFFFFIGAPLGAIIRKGGLGMPVVISVLFFIIYYIIDTSGYKMARDAVWVPWTGMWLSSGILLPIGLFLTYKSNKDSVILNAEAYSNWFKKILGIRSTRHYTKKEVVIESPNYEEIKSELLNLNEEINGYIKHSSLISLPNYLKLWTTPGQDADMERINNELERIVEKLTNTSNPTILQVINDLPIIPSHAHTRPFNIYFLNILVGLVIPLGVFFYFRIWRFRIRLNKDLKRVLNANQTIIEIINKD